MRYTARLVGLAFVPVIALAAPAHHAPVGGERSPVLQQLESELSRRSLAKYDPVRLLIEKRKDVAITEKQRADLESLDEPVKWNINKLASRIDSAQRDMNGGKGTMGGRRGSSAEDAPARSPEEARARIMADRKIILAALTELQREFDLRTGEALALLSESQKAGATAIIKKRGEENTKILDDAGYLTLLKAQRGAGGRTGER